MKYQIVMKLEILHGAAAASNSWPGDLPGAFQRRGFSITPASNAVRSEVDAGPVFQRPRYSVAVDIMMGAVVVDEDGLTAFWTFYQTTLMGGALRFNHDHPISGEEEVFQFDITEPPSVSPI